jgi:hypothetical protein
MKKVTASEALGRVDKLLSEAQDLLGQHVLYHGGREAHPLSYRRGNDSFSLIEEARKALRRVHKKG